MKRGGHVLQTHLVSRSVCRRRGCAGDPVSISGNGDVDFTRRENGIRTGYGGMGETGFFALCAGNHDMVIAS